MGIDIYMRWNGQTQAEHQAQITGFCTTAGNVGYLRESYHGGPYATRVLVREAFDAEDDAEIPAATLRERLPKTVLTALYRHHVLYEQGRDPADVGNGDLASLVAVAIGRAQDARVDQAPEPNDEQVHAVAVMIERDALPDYAQSFVDFVRLAERKEAEIGRPVRVYASW